VGGNALACVRMRCIFQFNKDILYRFITQIASVGFEGVLCDKISEQRRPTPSLTCNKIAVANTINKGLVVDEGECIICFQKNFILIVV
jgi:hypothetical protein